MNNKFTKEFFAQILSKEKDSSNEITELIIENFFDDPGLHWSNPGIKKASITTTSEKIELIIKILHEKSKREILIYRFLSKFQNFPIPKVYHTEYDETSKIYILITEFGESIGEWPFKEPEIKLCAVLLARIHSYFYGKIDSLPDLFFQHTYYQSRYKFKDNTVSFLKGLKKNDLKAMEKINPNFNNLKNAIESLDKDFFIIEPYTNWTLIHGAFHPPEIVSKKGEIEIMPLGVDWEASRVGHPAEDIIGITGQLADWGKPHYYTLMIESYLKELKNHQIIIDKHTLEKEIIVENIIREVRNLPFLWRQYIKNKDNPDFSSWVNWFRESMLKTTNKVLEDITKKHWKQV